MNKKMSGTGLKPGIILFMLLISTSAFVFAQVERHPSPAIISISPSSGGQAEALAITISGKDFVEGAKLSYSPPAGITIASVNFVSPVELKVSITVARDAPAGHKEVTVTNPDGQSDTLKQGFTVTTTKPVIDPTPPPAEKVVGEFLNGQHATDVKARTVTLTVTWTGDPAETVYVAVNDADYSMAYSGSGQTWMVTKTFEELNLAPGDSFDYSFKAAGVVGVGGSGETREAGKGKTALPGLSIALFLVFLALAGISVWFGLRERLFGKKEWLPDNAEILRIIYIAGKQWKGQWGTWQGTITGMSDDEITAAMTFTNNIQAKLAKPFWESALTYFASKTVTGTLLPALKAIGGVWDKIAKIIEKAGDAIEKAKEIEKAIKDASGPDKEIFFVNGDKINGIVIFDKKTKKVEAWFTDGTFLIQIKFDLDPVTKTYKNKGLSPPVKIKK